MNMEPNYSPERSDQDIDYTPVPEVVLTPEDEQLLREKVEFINRNADSFIRQFNHLTENFPEVIDAFNNKYPGFEVFIERMRQYQLVNVELLNSDEIISYINGYNEAARQVNDIIRTGMEYFSFDAAFSRTVDPATFEADIYALEYLPESEKQELIDFAIAQLEEEMPRSQVETWTRRIAGELTDEYDYETGEYPELTDLQDLAIAPARGMENAIRGAATLFTADTAISLYNTVKTLSDMSFEEFVRIMDFARLIWSDLSNTRKASVAVSALSGLILMRSVLGNGTTLPTRIANILTRAGIIFSGTNFYLRAAPAAVLADMYLEFIEV